MPGRGPSFIPQMATSTAAALAGLAGPDAAACWATLVERHGPDCWRIIASRSRDGHDAEDAYQEFWLGLPRAAAGFRPAPADEERAARAWLMRVAYTSAIDHGRRRRPIQASALAPPRSAAMDAHDPRTTGSGPLAHEPVAPGVVPRPGTDDLAERELLMARVQSAIGTLPETWRRPLVLHLVGGLSYDDLAADLRCTVNHARVKVHRGLKRLRELLGVDEQRLPDRSLAGLIVPLALTMPLAPPLPPPALVPPTPPPGTLAGVAKAASFVVIGSGVAAGMVAAALAVKADPPPPGVPVAPVPAAETVLPLDDFERDEPRMSGQGQYDIRPGLGVVPVPPGGGRGRGLRFAWPAGHSGWVDCTYDAPRRPVPELTAEVAGTVTMRVWCDGGAEVQHVAVRFADRHGEMFEWRRPLPDAGKAGWRELSFPLALLTPADWDRRPLADHRIDAPLTFWGYAVQLDTRLGRRAGTLIIDDVVLTLRR